MGAIKNIFKLARLNVKFFIIEHWFALLVMVAVAGIGGLPQIIARNALGPADRGIPFLINTDEGYYLGRIHEILDGHTSVSSPELYEYKDSIILTPAMGELLFYILPMKLTSLSLSNIVFLSRFILPALLFFFAYLFILSLSTRYDFWARLSAIVGALLIVIGYDAVDYRNFISNILHRTPDLTGLLWNRLVNPITGGVMLFVFLWLLSLIVKRKGRWPAIIISGLVLSTMSGYIFSFALGLTIPVFVGLYFVWRKNWPMVLRVYIPVAMALAVNIFYFVSVFLAMSGGVPLSDPRKAGMFFTHMPLINLISLISLIGVILCFILYFRKDTALEPEKRWWFFSLAVIVACELVYNQQIITGRTVYPQHFVQYTTPLCMAIGVVFLHNIIRPRLKNLWRVVVIFILIISVLFGWRTLGSVQATIPKYTELQSFSGVFDYLNANASKDCVVYVSSDYNNEINRFINALTSCNVYHSFYVYSGVPAERIMHNFLVDLRLRGIKPEDLDKYLNENSLYVRGYFFRDWRDMFGEEKWLRTIGDWEETKIWLASVDKDIEKRYIEYLKGNLYSELTRYRLDYFVVDTEKQPQVNDKNFPFLSLRGKFGQFVVYAIIKS